ncbi:hypothetical protein QTP88_008539 [Uroleucon formosanum]
MEENPPEEPVWADEGIDPHGLVSSYNCIERINTTSCQLTSLLVYTGGTLAANRCLLPQPRGDYNNDELEYNRVRLRRVVWGRRECTRIVRYYTHKKNNNNNKCIAQRNDIFPLKTPLLMINNIFMIYSLLFEYLLHVNIA